MMKGLAGPEVAEHKTIMIDATYLKARRTACSLWVKKGGAGRLIGRTKGGMNTKPHAVTDASGRPFKSCNKLQKCSSREAVACPTCLSYRYQLLPGVEW